MDSLSAALDDVEQAFRHLEFAIKLLCYCEHDYINRSKFDTDITILLETENIGFRSKTFPTLESLVGPAAANVGVSFGVSAIVLDAAFETAGIGRKPESNDTNDVLRTLVYMIRCAFAHNPANPKWEVRPPYDRRLTVPLEEATVSVDLTRLHDQPFDYDHIGGIANWFRVRDAATKIIAGA